MGIQITAKVTKKVNLKPDDLARCLLDLNPGDEVVIEIKSKTTNSLKNDCLHVPQFDALYQSLKELVREAGIDDSNGLMSYVDGNSIVIIEADEDEDDDDEWEDDDYE